MDSISEFLKGLQIMSFQANNLKKDMKNTVLNKIRINSLRDLLDQFENYNNLIEKENNHDTRE